MEGNKIITTSREEIKEVMQEVMMDGLANFNVNFLQKGLSEVNRKIDDTKVELKKDIQDARDYTDKRAGEVEGRLNLKLQKVYQRLDKMDERFDGIDQRFDGVDKRFDGVDKRFDGVDQRFDGVDQRLVKVEQGLGGVNQKLNTLTDVLEEKNVISGMDARMIKKVAV